MNTPTEPITPPTKNQRPLIIIAGILIVALSSIIFVLNKKTANENKTFSSDETVGVEENEAVKQTDSDKKDSATNKETEDSKNSQPGENQAENENKKADSAKTTPNQDALPSNPEKEIIALHNVTDLKQSGQASRAYKNKKFEANITAELKSPETNFYYEGWLIKNDGTITDLQSLGPLEKNDAGTYSVTFTSSKNYLKYKQIVVTIEPDDDDPDPAARILEGTFN